MYAERQTKESLESQNDGEEKSRNTMQVLEHIDICAILKVREKHGREE